MTTAMTTERECDFKHDTELWPGVQCAGQVRPFELWPDTLGYYCEVHLDLACKRLP